MTLEIRPRYQSPVLRLMPAWVGAVTIYPWILFREGRGAITDVGFRHELEHCYQVRRVGWLRFYLTYLWQAMRVGYDKIPYEVEANLMQVIPLTAEEALLKAWA
jgi:hypothetical protein